MNNVYDWITMIIFGGLVILFLQRSVGPTHPTDKLYHYLPPALGCAAADYLGNHGTRRDISCRPPASVSRIKQRQGLTEKEISFTRLRARCDVMADRSDREQGQPNLSQGIIA